ncbi:Archaic translocase outer mitochondrial membrane 40 [Novymonas esmeraldas]|uniref:Archaic translocase outer mitochondrial membrane 40 n=1 Tax=Novymonas esmeraldas TaxID=1808958 RepID=A0AAW0F5G7_9TRYP
MLREWLRGSSTEAEKPAETQKAPARMVVDAEKPLESHETAARNRRAAYEAKLAESLKEGPPHPSKVVTYDGLFRKAQGVLLEGNGGEVQEGITVNVARNAQNAMISTKWSLANPQTSHWEVNLQMNGFTDIVAASWNTLNRYQLMYQRVSSTGAMLVTQFMAQKQGGMSQGTVFAMLQYPWRFGGCTQVQYVKDQPFGLSHVQRLIRGVHVGTNLTVDPATRSSCLSHAISLSTPKKDAAFVAEMTPSKGTWRIAATAFDWAMNMDAAVELEYKERREGLGSMINVGCRRSFVGGAQLTTSLLGFGVTKVNLDLPFGGEMPGSNQLRLTFNCQYDNHSGALKQGLIITA